MPNGEYKRPSLRPGQVISSKVSAYRVIRFCGEGANGRVYAACVVGDRKIVAVKIFSPRKELSPRERAVYVARFKNEYLRTRALVHWNVVRVIDRGNARTETGKVPFIVLEYVPLSLEKALKSASQLQRLSYCGQLADALLYLKSRGYVHRDIKPANILVRDGDILKLSDFGIALVFDSRVRSRMYPEQTDPAQFPLFFLSPEEKEFFRHPTKYRSTQRQERLLQESDAFQLGRVSHEILTGKNPVGQIDLNSRSYESVPRFLRTVLWRLLSEEPENRLSLATAREIFHTTLALYFQLFSRKVTRLSLAPKQCLLSYFNESDALRVPGKVISDKNVSWIQSRTPLGLKELVLLGIVHESIGRRHGNEELATYRLTPSGRDWRNAALQNRTWLRLVRYWEDSHTAPHPLFIGTSHHELQKPWRKWKPNPYGRHIREFASGAIGETGRCYILPPRRIADRWYAELLIWKRTSFAWRGYDVAPFVIDARSEGGLLDRLRKLWQALDLGGLRGFSLEGKFYLSKTYLHMEPGGIYTALTKAGPVTIICVVEPGIPSSIEGTDAGLDLGLDWILLERKRFPATPSSAGSIHASAFVAKYSNWLRQAKKDVSRGSEKSESRENPQIREKLISLFNRRFDVASNEELRSIHSVLLDYFRKFALNIKRRDVGWELYIEPVECDPLLELTVAQISPPRTRPKGT